MGLGFLLLLALVDLDLDWDLLGWEVADNLRAGRLRLGRCVQSLCAMTHTLVDRECLELQPTLIRTCTRTSMSFLSLPCFV